VRQISDILGHSVVCARWAYNIPSRKSHGGYNLHCRLQRTCRSVQYHG